MSDESARPESTHELAGTAGPVGESERLDALDALRGVAVLGILLMNIYAFAMPFPAYANPLLMGGLEWWNVGTWTVTHILVDQKFLSIFAMLFGAGLVLMAERAAARGTQFGRIYYRRSFWLLLIGAAHGYLIWFGDILFHYALMGMLIYPLRNKKPKTLIIIACCLLPVALLLNYGNAIQMEQSLPEIAEIQALQEAGGELSEEQSAKLEEWEVMRPFVFPTQEDLQKDVDAYLGSYGEIVVHRAPVVIMFQVFVTLFVIIWRVGGLMLIGMALMKLDVFSGKRSTRFYRNMMLLGYLVGLPLTTVSAMQMFSHEFDGLYVMRVGFVPNYFGSIAVAFGHIGLVMLIFKSGVLQKLMHSFAAVGRMALTNYLLHSIILTTVFYGYGLGLYGRIPRLWQMAFVAAVFALQLVASPIWLRRYRFGPAEWLWRSLTYWRRQPMRRAA